MKGEKMDCTLASNVIVFGGVAFGALVGYTTEYILTAKGYKPTNYLAKWRAKWQSRKAKATPLTA